ncbi:MAG: LCP family protein [Selenomonadaceae bacterium]|nr:LCP family protein [Selenomonadaceae bacterium]
MIRERLEERRKEIRTKLKKKFFVSALCFVVAVAFAGLYAGFNFSFIRNNLDLNDPKNISEKTSSAVLPTIQDNMTIMLLGVDERNEDVGRSDTLMLLNLSDDKVSLLSIPRDTRVYVERHGYQKINAAYAHGGEKLTRSTLEDFLGIDVDRYVKINTSEFVKLIDVIGGIDIFVEKPMHYEDPWDDDGGLYIHLDEGLQHLDGKGAVKFVRFRDDEGDAGRVRRQQTFMKACADRLSDPSILLKLPEIFSVVTNAVETDLTSSEMLSIAGTLKAAENSHHVKTGVVPGYWQYIDGVSYLVPDSLRLGEIMTQNLGIDADKKHFEKLSSEYGRGLAADLYDVNPNFERDLRIMDAVEREKWDLSENNL